MTLMLTTHSAARTRREKRFALAPRRQTSFDSGQTASSLHTVMPQPQYGSQLRQSKPILHGQITTASRLADALRLDQSAWLELLSQLSDAWKDTHEDDLPPTNHAACRALTLLKAVSPQLPPGGYLYRDGDGGLSVEWKHQGRRLYLILHGLEEHEDHLYWQNDESSSIETPITASLLAKRFEWLRGSDK